MEFKAYVVANDLESDFITKIYRLSLVRNWDLFKAMN